jgi:hypothetical protein
MKKFGVCTILSIGVFCALLLLAPINALADSVTLTVKSFGPWSGSYNSVAPAQSLGGNVYPYGFTVSGTLGTVNANLMCLSYENDIEIGEHWTATPTAVAGNASYEEAAYIFSLAVAPGASLQTVVDAQWADWALFDTALTQAALLNDGTGTNGTSIDLTDTENMLTAASNYVTANPNSTLYSEYVIYVPSSDGYLPDGKDDGVPQTLIGIAPAPESSSLILLASGMLGLAALFYGRKRKGVKGV